MRHGKKFNHLGRKTGHRRAMLANMTVSLIEHKRITTTLAKAKALRQYAEPIITKSKDDSTHSRRIVFSYLKDKNAVTELFREVAPKVASRPGGYLRIIKTGARSGDNAEMAVIELVDFNELYSLDKKPAGKKRSRRSKGGAAKATAAAAEVTTAAASSEETEAKAAKPEKEVASEAEVKAEKPADKPAEDSADNAKEKKD